MIVDELTIVLDFSIVSHKSVVDLCYRWTLKKESLGNGEFSRKGAFTFLHAFDNNDTTYVIENNRIDIKSRAFL